ncbi:hypothetical protein MKW98_006239 [Papaver atlanticum]|uniref:Uncharacterized protein n=1 Tax=Papaver atlanticum TaxID=357466 RepID=A0AAD4TE66_9MAGN|nr:hypothetical protein MKW98_006239 [Papaver atlanticum]
MRNPGRNINVSFAWVVFIVVFNLGIVACSQQNSPSPPSPPPPPYLHDSAHSPSPSPSPPFLHNSPTSSSPPPPYLYNSPESSTPPPPYLNKSPLSSPSTPPYLYKSPPTSPSTPPPPYLNNSQASSPLTAPPPNPYKSPPSSPSTPPYLHKSTPYSPPTPPYQYKSSDPPVKSPPQQPYEGSETSDCNIPTDLLHGGVQVKVNSKNHQLLVLQSKSFAYASISPNKDCYHPTSSSYPAVLNTLEVSDVETETGVPVNWTITTINTTCYLYDNNKSKCKTREESVVHNVSDSIVVSNEPSKASQPESSFLIFVFIYAIFILM